MSKIFGFKPSIFAALALICMTAVSALAANGYSLFGGAELVSPGYNSPTSAQLASTTAEPFSGVDLTVPEGLTVGDLENLSTWYYFEEGTCGGGAPRFTVGTNEGNIFIYLGDYPNYTNCPQDIWTNSGNLVEDGDYVDTSQLGGNFYQTWADAVAAYGDLEITSIQLVNDGSWFAGDVVVKVDNVDVNGMIWTFESKNSCKNGGFGQFLDEEGNQLYKNQGQCVSYYARGGE
ncbi:MAG: hypothetical protein ABIR33_03060 [Pyrinomonadaceae bacterium]